MRKIDLLIIHCAATTPTMDIGLKEIDRWHRQKGYLKIGYHYVIRRDGTIENGRPITEAGAHAINYNAASIGICLVGGLNAAGKAECNFTEKQWQSLNKLVADIEHTYKGIKIIGHNEVANKACPCFNVQQWLKNGRETAKENKI